MSGTDPPRLPSGPGAVVVTLFEGDYHLGVAALVNSLVRNGFRGEVWAGFRGRLPRWARADEGDRIGAEVRWEVADGVQLRLLPVDTDLHLTWYKPAFLLDVMARSSADHEIFAYLDPDIVVKADWSRIQPWFTPGAIALVEDVNCYLPARHPKRLQWDEFFAGFGHRRSRHLDRYYNAGFIGVRRDQAAFLTTWQDLCEIILRHHRTAGGLRSGGPEDLFESSDQDALNYALSLSSAPINGAGPEAMDFAPGGHYLSHAAGGHKPWRIGHLRRSLAGYPPAATAKAYLDYASGPIRATSPSELSRLRRDHRAAAAVGRVYRRT